MRKVVSVLVAALVAAGCGASPDSTPPGAPAATTVVPATDAPISTPDVSLSPTFRDGPLPAGTYSFLRAIGTIDVPAGWEGCCDAWGVLKNDSGILFEDITNVTVYADSCRWSVGPSLRPKGAEAAAAAFSAQGGHQGTPPERVTVAGLPGWHVRLTVPADQAFTGCDEGQFRSWGQEGDDAARYHETPSQVDDLYIVDVGTQTILFDVVSYPDTPASVRAELEAMLASVRIR